LQFSNLRQTAGRGTGILACLNTRRECLSLPATKQSISLRCTIGDSTSLHHHRPVKQRYLEKKLIISSTSCDWRGESRLNSSTARGVLGEGSWLRSVLRLSPSKTWLSCLHQTIRQSASFWYSPCANLTNWNGFCKRPRNWAFQKYDC